MTRLAFLLFLLVAGCCATPRPSRYRGDGKDTDRLRWIPRTLGAGEILLAPEFAGATPLIVTRMPE